jgi:putative acetyltransferase
MFVRPKSRGLGRLETGIHQPEVLGLHRAAGDVEREPFGEYGPDPLSVFMQKAL